MPKDTYEKVAGKIDLPSYFREYTDRTLTEDGEGFIADCLDNPGKQTMKLSIYNGKWSYHCTECGKRGDIIDVHARLNNIDIVRSHRDLAEKYGINIGGKEAPLDLQSAKQSIQKYLHNCLMNNEQARDQLAEDGVTEQDIVRHGYGLTDENLYEHFKHEFSGYFQNLQGCLELLVDTGIAEMKKDVVRNFIPAGRITIPIQYNGRIGSWYITKRSRSDKSRIKQIPIEKWDVDTLFFNQEVAEDKTVTEFWLVHDPYDAILLTKAGKRAIAMMSFTERRTTWLQNLKVIHPIFEELGKHKKIHIAIENLYIASKMAYHLIDYHQLTAYHLPEKKSIGDCLLQGQSLNDIKSTNVDDKKSKITVEGRTYWIDRGENTQKLEQISNFTLTRRYMYIDDEGKKTYDVYLDRNDGYRVGATPYESINFKNVSNFREWLGYRGDFFFSGKDNDLQEMLVFLHHHDTPAHILKKDCFGKLDKGNVWLASNGILSGGEFQYSDNDEGVIMTDKAGTDGITTLLRRDPVVRYKFPKEHWDIDKIVEMFLTFYPPDIAWTQIGIATAVYYHDIIRAKYGKFIVPCWYGQTKRGKTCAAKATASLLGAGETRPSSDSTSKGIGRLMSCMKNLPPIVNEAEEERLKKLIRATYDGDPSVMAYMSYDDRVKGRGISTTMFLTTEIMPREASIINRLIPLNFWNFEKPQDRESIEMFEEFEFEGITQAKNIGWLKALNGTNGHETILEDVRHATDIFFECGGKSDVRIIHNLSMVFGSVNNAFKKLNIHAVLERLREKHKDGKTEISARIYERAVPPDRNAFAGMFKGLAMEYDSLTHEESPLRNFFTIIERMTVEGEPRLKKLMRFDSEQGGRRYVIMRVGDLFSLAKEKDIKSERRMLNASASEIRNEIKTAFNITSSKSRMGDNKKVSSVYKIYIDQIEEQLGVRVYEHEEEWEWDEPPEEGIPF